MTDLKALTDEFWARFESNRPELLSELLDSDCEFKMPGMTMRGRAGLLQVLGAYRVAFPDLRHHVLHHVTSGDTIALELRVEGTHTGPMQTPEGVVPATGKHVTWESCDYVRVRGGKICSWHVYHDSVPFLTALGLLPARAS